MKNTMFQGALTGLILSVPLLAVFYLGNQLHIFPFMPFDLFDWMSKILPGWILIPSIELMVKIIHLFISGPTDVVAKNAEQTIAIIQFMILQGITGLCVSFFVGHFQGKHLTIGIVTGLIFFLFSVALEQELKDPFTVGEALVLGLVMIVWSTALVFSLLLLQSPVIEGEKTENTDENRRKILLRIAGISLGSALILGIAGKFIVHREKKQPGRCFTRFCETINGGAIRYKVSRTQRIADVL